NIVRFIELNSNSNMQVKYNSCHILGYHLANENIETFSSTFINEAKECEEKNEQNLKENGMKNVFLECDKMKVRDECAAYELTLGKAISDDQNENDEKFKDRKSVV